MRAFRQGEHVANGGAADGDATQERVTLEGNQPGLGYLRIEIIAGQFSAYEPVIGAVVDEIVHVDRFGICGPVLCVGGCVEVIPKAVRGQAQVESRLAVAPDRRRGGKANRQNRAKASGG